MVKRLSRVQRLALSYMGKRHAENGNERITMVALKSHGQEGYKPPPTHGNFRKSLLRLVDRGLLTEVSSEVDSGRKVTSYMLTELGMTVAKSLLENSADVGHVTPVFFI
ncbi:hypothetical protein [Enterobacter soli]|uniref:hypothetical protein n=1 Tax=Enterobacter soli TaxID=885040 RepID=UPI002F425097